MPRMNLHTVSGVAVVSALALVVSLGAQSAAPGQGSAVSCEKLTAMKLAGGTVTSARFVAAGALPPPPARGGGPPPAGGRGNPFADLPALCQVAATMRPSADSNIKIEVWM